MPGLSSAPQGICTTAAVALRTSGKTSSSTGNAITHDKPHEPSHSTTKPSAKPTPRKVLTNEMMHVMMMDKNSGITMLAYLAGSFGRPKGPLLGVRCDVIGANRSLPAR